MRKTKSDKREKILKSAFTLAAEKGWDNTSLEDIAQKAGVAVEVLRGYECNDKSDIVKMFNNMTDDKVIKQYLALEKQGDFDGYDERERLFEILMLRMEALNENREGVKAIYAKTGTNLLGHFPNLRRSMGEMLETVGVDTSDLKKGEAKILGLVGVYSLAIKAWSKDETEGLNQTVKSLHNNLHRVEKWSRKIGLN
jgi:ubiquinone biosynthesis protein COQ9